MIEPNDRPTEHCPLCKSDDIIIAETTLQVPYHEVIRCLSCNHTFPREQAIIGVDPIIGR